jgi:hypothetical protein
MSDPLDDMKCVECPTCKREMFIGKNEPRPSEPCKAEGVTVERIKQIINTCVAEAVHQSWSDDALVTAIAEDVCQALQDKGMKSRQSDEEGK